MLTQEILKSLLEYNPMTGDFTWIAGHQRMIGKRAGYVSAKGYVSLSVNGKPYFAHRLAFLYMTGDLPKHEVDHQNGDRADNRWDNLRDVTSSQNSKNTKIRSNTGIRCHGVSYRKRDRIFAAYIYINGKYKDLGSFRNLFDAACARRSAEKVHGYHINHGAR